MKSRLFQFLVAICFSATLIFFVNIQVEAYNPQSCHEGNPSPCNDIGCPDGNGFVCGAMLCDDDIGTELCLYN
ncbi:MAG: hypothetical protein WD016_06600 [Balneolaceae bacterium]